MYEEAPNKSAYLKSVPADLKPSIDEQYDAFGVHFLNDNNLGYKSGAGGEEKRALYAQKLMVGVLKFVNKRRTIIGYNQVGKYENSALLCDIKQ